MAILNAIFERVFGWRGSQFGPIIDMNGQSREIVLPSRAKESWIYYVIKLCAIGA